MRTRLTFALLAALATSSTFAISANAQTGKTPLNPLTVPKYSEALSVPPIYAPTEVKDPATGAVLRHEYRVYVTQFRQQLLPAGFPQTTVWGYGGQVVDRSPGAPPGSTLI